MGNATFDGRWAGKSALILSGDTAYRRSISEMAQICGLNLLADSASGHWPAADIVIADVRTGPDAVPLAAIAQYRQSRAVPMMISADLSGIDAAFAALADADTHWLVETSDAEALALLATLAHRPKITGVREESDAPDYAALHRISGELADFARMLAGIAGQSASAAPTPVQQPVSFRKSEASARAMPLDPVQIRRLIRARRLRDAYFTAGLFGEPAWDILLDLMAAKLEGISVSVSSLCIAAAVPPTTALRCITAMTEGGMLERSADRHDARRIFMSLSPGTEAAMRRYLAETLG